MTVKELFASAKETENAPFYCEACEGMSCEDKYIHGGKVICGRCYNDISKNILAPSSSRSSIIKLHISKGRGGDQFKVYKVNPKSTYSIGYRSFAELIMSGKRIDITLKCTGPDVMEAAQLLNQLLEETGHIAAQKILGLEPFTKKEATE